MNCDPAEIWRSLFRENKKCDRRPNYYDDESASYQFSENPYMWIDGEQRCKAINIEQDWTVLDIGAGAGSMTIPLAKKSRHVTTVEPSKTMARILSANLKKNGITNVTIINSRWETAPSDIGKHDVVIAAYSLMMDDIEKAVLRMNSLARQRVYVYWFAGVPFWERPCIDLWPVLHGYSYTPSPKVDLVFAVLYKHGIYADVVNLDCDGSTFERSMTTQEALAELQEYLHVKDGVHDTLLMKYIKENYAKIKDDCWSRADESSRLRISWQPQP